MKSIRFFRFLGIVSALTAWVVIYVSIINNPWFDLFKHALSDLGDLNANNPWIYNNGLIATGILVLLYSIYLISISQNKLETTGSAFVAIAAIFLALIGIFPSGTRPHVFVSTWFFIQMDLSIAMWGLGLLIRGLSWVGALFIALSIISPVIALTFDWPSVAIQEIFGILVIDLWVLMMYIKIHRYE